MRTEATRLTPEGRRWRVWLLVACGLAVVACFFGDFACSPVLQWCSSVVGFRADYVSSASDAQMRITEVDPKGPAARAGFRVGDLIHLNEIGFRERWRLRDARRDIGFPVGEQLYYLLHRADKTLAAKLVPQRVAPSWGAWTDWIPVVAALWGILFAAILAVRRSDLQEARLLSLLLLSYFGGISLTGDIAPSPVIGFWAVVFGSIVNGPLVWAIYVTFSGLTARPLSRSRRWLTGITIALAIATSIIQIVSFVGYFFLASFSQLYVGSSTSYLFCAGDFAAISCGIAAIVAARGIERQRAAWVLAAVAPLFATIGVLSLVYSLLSTPVELSIEYALNAFTIILPIGITYAVLSRRCIDIGYVVNRVTVFGALSAFVLAVFVIVEWALSSWISNASHTASLVVNAVVALALGLSIRFIHRHIENVVDRAFFRKRHEDENALHRFAREAAFITDRQTLLDRTVAVVEQHADVGRVRLLLMNGKVPYENDPAVVAMRTWHEPVDLHRYNTIIEGERAFPMSSRGRLAGVLVCDPKRGGEAYSPDESEAIEEVAHGVASALDAFSTVHRNELTIQLHQELLDELRALPSKIAEIINNGKASPPA